MWHGNTKEASARNQIDPIIFPVHFAVARALETGADTTWIAGWSKTSGIDKNLKLSQQELALQIYREKTDFTI